MRTFRILIAAAALPLLVQGVPALAAERAPQPVQLAQQGQAGGQIYGSQLMNQQERQRYRAEMRNAKTAEEQEQIRARHHAEMQERARKQGITLPDEPPADRGPGMGRGMGGPGQGMGRGMGMGGGR